MREGYIVSNTLTLKLLLIPIVALLISIPGSTASIELGGLITQDVICEGQNILLNGNVTIVGSTLKLDNCILSIVGDGKYILSISDGSVLNISNSEVDGRGRLSIVVDESSSLFVRGSTLSGLGWLEEQLVGNLFSLYSYPGPPFLDIDFKGGVAIQSYASNTVIESNIISGVSGISVFGDYSRIVNNTFLNVSIYAFLVSGDESLVSSNKVVGGDSSLYESYGIYVDGSTNIEISFNIISDVGIGISLKNVSKSEITGNVLEDLFIGMKVEGYSLLIEDNVINSIEDTGILFSYVDDVVIQSNLISNFSMFDNRKVSMEYFDSVSTLYESYNDYLFNYLRRGGLLFIGDADNIVIRENLIEDIPLYGFGISFVTTLIADNITIADNEFMDIGVESLLGLAPKDFTVKWIGIEPIRFETPFSASIELSSTDEVDIYNNTFRYVLTGVSTIFYNSSGNYGDLLVRNNLFEWMSPDTWNSYMSSEYGLIAGIVLSTRGEKIGVSRERGVVYYGDRSYYVEENKILNYVYPYYVENPFVDRKFAYILNNEIDSFYLNLTQGNVTLSGNEYLNDLKPNIAITNVTVYPSDLGFGLYEILIILEHENIEYYEWADYVFRYVIEVDGSLVDMQSPPRLLRTIRTTVSLSPGNHTIGVAVFLSGLSEKNKLDNFVEEVVNTFGEDIEPIVNGSITTPPVNEVDNGDNGSIWITLVVILIISILILLVYRGRRK